MAVRFGAGDPGATANAQRARSQAGKTGRRLGLGLAQQRQLASNAFQQAELSYLLLNQPTNMFMPSLQPGMSNTFLGGEKSGYL